MTGRDLIIYILSNNLEDEPIDKDGKLIGFLTIAEAAEKMKVGMGTVYAWIAQNQIKYIDIGTEYLIFADCEVVNN